MPHDWPGDEVREKDDENRVVERAVVQTLVSRYIHEVSDLREGKERDRKRQDDVQPLKCVPARAPKRVEDEVCVFVVAEQQQVYRNAGHHRQARCGASAPAIDSLGNRVVEADGEKQQRNVFDLPPAVEKQRRRNQPPFPGCLPLRRNRKKARDRDRQKDEDELPGAEQHQAARRWRNVSVRASPPGRTVAPGKFIGATLQTRVRTVKTPPGEEVAQFEFLITCHSERSEASRGISDDLQTCSIIAL